MHAKFPVTPLIATFGFSAAALAVLPLPNTLSLSDILRHVEQDLAPKYIDDVSWDNNGYREVDYSDEKGRKTEIKIDPVTEKICK